MATNQHRPRDPAETPQSGVSPSDHSPDDAPVADDTGGTEAEITSPFEQGNSIVLTVTQYFDEDQPLYLFERHANGRTCLIIEEVPDT